MQIYTTYAIIETVTGLEMDSTSPLGIFLVKSGSKGDRLLFRYPFDNEIKSDKDRKSKKRNPYAMASDIEVRPELLIERMFSGQDKRLCGFSDEVLSKLLAVKNDLANQKFEMKINDIRFVGHPSSVKLEKECPELLTSNSPSRDQQTKFTTNLFNIVFALRASAGHSVVNCYHAFSQRLIVSLMHEERRCGYLSSEAKIMTSALDPFSNSIDNNQLPFKMIIDGSQLARDLKRVFDDLTERGEVLLKINQWIEVSFCLPHKIHRLPNIVMMPDAIEKCLTALRPYHAILLMDSKKALVNSLPLDASPALARLILISSPSKCLQTLAADCDLTLTQVFQLVGHLLYWAKVMVIYPLCESNVYMLSPNAPTHIASTLMANFTDNFPGLSLLAVMADFSLPIALGAWNSPSRSQYQSKYVHIIIWMLQHRLLIQLHTYIYLVTGKSAPVMFLSSSSQSKSHESQMIKLQNEFDTGSVTSDDLSESFNQSSSKLSESADSAITSPSERELLPETHMIMYKGLNEIFQNEVSQSDRDIILGNPAASRHEDLSKFIKLLPYFKGQHHVEEIMYYENVRRSEVLAILDKFREILVTCQHEDIAVAAFYRSTIN